MGYNKMKVNIAAVGKIKEKYFADAITEYVKRTGRFADVKITECPEYPPKTQSPAEIALSVEKEGKKLLDNLKGFVVLTAIEGRIVSSEELAALIDAKMTEGISEITFVIGGSNGVSDEVKRRTDVEISFGRVTYPHQLMRVILSEQIYRAFSIINKLPYHK